MSTEPPHDTAPAIDPASSEPTEPTRRRKPWAAGLFSLVVPGLGQLYAGAPARALAVWLGVILASVAGLRAALSLPGKAQVPAILLVAVVILAVPPWDAVRTARVSRPARRRPAYDRWYVYTAIILLSIFVWQPRYNGWLRANLAIAYRRIASQSMEPTLLRGDCLFTVPLRGAVRRGDLIVHATPAGTFIKRVVAIPGDTVAMRYGRLVLQGHPMAESYVQWTDTADVFVPEFQRQRRYLAPSVDPASYRPSMRSWGPLVVPPDRYFLLGDNRANSLDSRYLGFEPRAGLIARPTIIYFSADSAVGVRWDRMGRRVR